MRNVVWVVLCLGACAPVAQGVSDGSMGLPDAARVGDAGPDAGARVSDANGVDAPYVPMPGSCGLAAPAFCETFEAGPVGACRAGELDEAWWSGARSGPLDVTAGEQAMWIGPWRSPIWPREPLPCRGETSGWGLSDTDTRICDPTSTIPSRHLLVASAVQNYGMNGYRIRRPFDFTGRTGTIVFDADLTLPGLNGWAGITISADPTPAPSFDAYERGSGPRNGVEVQFQTNGCYPTPGASVTVHHFRGYAEQPSLESEGGCALTQFGALNHVEVEISATHLRVTATDFSTDGSPGAPHVLFDRDVALGFSTGYVTLGVYNHATIKYETGAAIYTRWDNVGFDGPVIDGWQEHSVPAARRALTVDDTGCLIDGVCHWYGDTPECRACLERPSGDPCQCPLRIDGINEGYRLDDTTARFVIDGVSLEGMSRARLVFTAFYRTTPDVSAYTLRYRLNEGAWHDRALDEEERVPYTYPNSIGLLNQVVELPIGEMREGANTIELATRDVPTNEGPLVVNVDLLLTR